MNLRPRDTQEKLKGSLREEFRGARGVLGRSSKTN
jgi:hypothetical protein